MPILNKTMNTVILSLALTFKAMSEMLKKNFLQQWKADTKVYVLKETVLKFE